jgi:hypothetical protein
MANGTQLTSFQKSLLSPCLNQSSPKNQLCKKKMGALHREGQREQWVNTGSIPELSFSGHSPSAFHASIHSLYPLSLSPCYISLGYIIPQPPSLMWIFRLPQQCSWRLHSSVMWLHATGQLMPTILRHHSGLIFKGPHRINCFFDIPTLENDTIMLSLNVTASKAMPHPRIKTSFPP